MIKRIRIKRALKEKHCLFRKNLAEVNKIYLDKPNTEQEDD